MKVKTTLVMFVEAVVLAETTTAATTANRDVEVSAESLLHGESSSSSQQGNHVGTSADVWGFLLSPHNAHSSGSASWSGPNAGDVAHEFLQSAESVATAALPFDLEKCGIVAAFIVAAVAVVSIAAALVGVRRQQLSEPRFGPVELASDLPEPMTTSAVAAISAVAHSETGLSIDMSDEDEREARTVAHV